MFLPSILALTIPTWLPSYGPWIFATLIVVLGLLVFGRSDLARLSFQRIWAISGVSFAESIRRRVLWVTPLAILGVIVVSQLQHPVNEQEAIRQTTKFSLFACGLLVTVTAIILACTNLPREIENRVIFTIVTKPTTRLEIVLGKVIGFARVSATILLIMGLFTFGYLELRAWRLESEIRSKLATLKGDSVTEHNLRGYLAAGLLSTKSLETPNEFGVYDHRPEGEGSIWERGGEGYYFLVPFRLSADDKSALRAAAEGGGSTSALVINTMRIRQHPPTPEELKLIHESQQAGQAVPTAGDIGPLPPGKAALPLPQIEVRLLDQNLAAFPKGLELNGGKPLSAAPQSGPSADSPQILPSPIPPDAVKRLLSLPLFFVEVVLTTPSVEYEISETPAVLAVVDQANGQLKGTPIKPAEDPRRPGHAMPPQFRSRLNRFGNQVTGRDDGKGSVAAYHFHGADVGRGRNGKVALQLRVGIERAGDLESGQNYSVVGLDVVNRKTGKSSGTIRCTPETNADLYVDVPVESVQGGDFDVYLRGFTDGQWVGVLPTSLSLVSGDRSFAINLFKSLFILWLMSLLVVVISVFCSTFLSWPIAIVLTLVLLLGHWAVVQLGDALEAGVGRSTANDLGFGSSATEAKMVSESVEALARLLKTVAAVLPDVSKFPVIDDIDRGISIPPMRVFEGLGVLACYGLPLLVLSYQILKNKEVAP